MTSLFEEVSPDAPSDVPVRRVTITVNGERRTADIEPRLLLAHLLRQEKEFTVAGEVVITPELSL